MVRKKSFTLTAGKRISNFRNGGGTPVCRSGGSKRRNKTLETPFLEDMAGSRWNAKMDGGREKLAAKCEVTRTAGSGSQTSEMEAERLSAEVTAAKREDDEKVLPMEKAEGCSQESKRIQDVTQDTPCTEIGGGKGLRNLVTEGLGFLPSAVSEPQCALYTCDNKCREESFKFFQLVAVVTEEGGAAHTIDMCKQCYNEGRLKQGEQPGGES